MDYEDAMSIVTYALRQQHGWEEAELPPDTPIFAPHSELDSLDLVSVLIEVEGQVREETGQEISLTMAGGGKPKEHYATIASMAEYVVELTSEP